MSVSVGKLRPSGRSLRVLLAVTCGIVIAIGDADARAADPPATGNQPAAKRKPTTATRKPTPPTGNQPAPTGKRPTAPRKRPTVPRRTTALPAFKDIQAAYRKNFTKLMPLGVEYRVTIAETPAAIEVDRQRLSENQALAKSKPGDIIINGEAVKEAEHNAIIRNSTDQIQYLTVALAEDAVKNRLTGWVNQRLYLWTDGESFHIRSARDPSAANVALFPTAVTPPDDFQKLYGSMTLASWSKSNNPPMRCWFGGMEPGQGRVANTLSDCISIAFAPMGFVKSDWTHKRDWHEWDNLMAADPNRFQVVKKTEVKGRVMFIVDEVVDKGERVRAWIDPKQGCLPLRMEWSYVSTADNTVTPFHRDLQILAVKQVAGGFYPAQIRRRDLILDPKMAEKQRQEYVAGTLPKDASRPPLVPGRTTTWEITEFASPKAIEPAALALEFPAGALYINAVDERTYRSGDSQPLPPAPQPIQPSQVAPPLKIAAWTDGKTRNLDNFKGKVIVLIFSQQLGDPQDDEKSADAITAMKTLHGKFGPKGVVFLEIFGAGSDIQRVRDFQKARGWVALAGVDEFADPNTGATSLNYLAGNDAGFVVIGRDGRAAFNFDALEEQAAMQTLVQAAQTLAIPWPLDEDAPEEQINRQGMQIFEYIFSKQIEQALAVEK